METLPEAVPEAVTLGGRERVGDSVLVPVPEADREVLPVTLVQTLGLRVRVPVCEVLRVRVTVAVALAVVLPESVRGGERLRVSVGEAVLEVLSGAPIEPVALCARLPLEDPVLLSDTDTQVLAEGLAEEEGEKEGEVEAQGLGEPESEGEEEDD